MWNEYKNALIGLDIVWRRLKEGVLICINHIIRDRLLLTGIPVSINLYI